uniref:LysM and putative peptidoglycan-binding domain-containing protein 2 n=1 Tax=Cyprinus carpio carpio TaxID=630221 RepID=A0A9J7X8I4_CYPCA
MAEFSPVLPPLRDDGGGGRYGQPLFPRSRCGSESDSELFQSLARTKTRSYGSTASVTAPLGERYIEHRVTDGDTLQGIALKYGVTRPLCTLEAVFGEARIDAGSAHFNYPGILAKCQSDDGWEEISLEQLMTWLRRKYLSMEQIKRVNKLFSNDCIFLRNTLNIPVKSEKRFNGLSLESPDSEGSTPQESLCVSQDVDASSPPPEPAGPEPNTRPVQAEELSAKDYLHRLDLQIKQSKQAARKLKEDGEREEDDPANSTSSYQEI